MYEEKLKKVAEAFGGRTVQLLLGSEENPISIEELLARIPSEIGYQIESVLARSYKDPRKCDYPILPQFLSVVFMKTSRMKWFTQLDRALRANNCKIAELFGFKKNLEGKTSIPDKNNFWYFVKVRIGDKHIENLLAEMLRLLKETANRNKIKFAETVGQDPLVFESNDKEAEYNGHYEKKMYKAQAACCLDTIIPLYGDVKGGTEYAGNDSIAYIEKYRAVGIKPKRVCLDGEYDNLENFALLNVKYKCGSYIRMHTPEITPETEKHIRRDLKKAYQKVWNKPGFKSNATTEEIAAFLAEKGELELSGRYYRSRYRKLAVNNSREFYGVYHRRSLEETVNSRLLDPALMSPETTCNGSGKRNKNIHWKWCILSIQLLALIRMYYGARRDFTSVKGVAF